MITKPLIQNTISYFQDYILLAHETDLIKALEINRDDLINLFSNLSPIKINYAYDINKWSIKQILQHIIDSERIFAYRAFRFSRQDSTELQGYDDEEYVKNSNSVKRTLNDMLEEFIAVRNSSIYLYKSLSEEMLDFKGVANGNMASARIYGWLSVGHAIHHCNVIEDRYL